MTGILDAIKIQHINSHGMSLPTLHTLRKSSKTKLKVNTGRYLPVIKTLIQCMFGLYEILLHDSITEKGKEDISLLS